MLWKFTKEVWDAWKAVRNEEYDAIALSLKLRETKKFRDGG